MILNVPQWPYMYLYPLVVISHAGHIRKLAYQRKIETIIFIRGLSIIGKIP